MRRRSGYRAGYGALATPDMRREALREYFLCALPQTLWEDLYARTRPASGRSRLSRGRRETIIRQWARSYYLDQPWIREYARNHVSAWTIWLSVGGHELTGTPGVADPVPAPTPDKPPAYFPAIETTEQYLKRVHQYVRLVDNFYRRRGYRQVPQNRDPKHLRLLVDYQVNGRSLTALAREVQGHPDAAANMVWKAVNRLAEELGLRLRPRLKRTRLTQARQKPTQD